MALTPEEKERFLELYRKASKRLQRKIRRKLERKMKGK